ncbi:2-succinyl-5-enolpyruvyl-6-hydroxy-3-cyclohexene-1-carboxylic-acid synthase [Cryomorphaceae bacterium 1068]|nr:2-succinyl-5-enolpyruvyl-6-hydroxy-3-cyclohexene-1-carboxylic-acid synthase [Cryomorphaceae bacterium 1068]
MDGNQAESQNTLKFAKKHDLILSDKKGVQTLVMAARDFGVKHVVISPGSRNAPITISFNRSEFFTCHSIPDERSAGFYGLGLALKTGDPVALICTSGSAAANYLPAITEAFFNRVPLVAITADRPLSWTDQGNGQTIRQEGIYSNHIKNWFSLITEPRNEEEEWQNRRLLSKAFNTALTLDPGPIHINVPLFEPLYQTVKLDALTSSRFYKSELIDAPIEMEAAKELAESVRSNQRVMILVGQHRHDKALLNLLEQWSDLPNVVILTETTGNIGIPKAIDTIDRIVMPLEKAGKPEEFMPQILITLGGYVISKKLKNLLRQYKPSTHWHIHPHESGLDTYMSLTHEIHADPTHFLSEAFVSINTRVASDYAQRWMELKSLAAEGHRHYLDEAPYSDFKVFEIINDELTQSKNLTLHLSNSTPVRYIQLLGLNENLTYHCNRGTSGIDGCTSTAAGWAKAAPDEDVLLITGDMSFVYDSNGLWNNRLPENFKIIVINNQGGGIFRIIEGSDSNEERERFFEAHHPVNIERLASAFDLTHFKAHDEASLKNVLGRFLNQKGAGILEVVTPAKVNDQILKNYFKKIAERFKLLENQEAR